MKKNKWIVMLVVTALINLIMIPMSFAADEGSTGGFSYEVIKPDNQIDKGLGYFDLKMEPGQKQTTVIKLNNTSSEEIKIAVSLNGAKTNGNGVIEYGDNSFENDASLKYAFEDVVSAPEEVTIPAKSQRDLKLEIKMPEASFEGYISGGIQLEELGQEANATGMVVNKFAYLVGMLLSEEDTSAIQPDLVFNKTYPELNNYRNAIFINFSNVQPVYLEDMTTDVQIMKKDSDQVIYDTKKTGMRMASNTMINFPVPMNGERMSPGDYRAKVLVTSKDGGRWEWLEEFTITDEEADKFNEQDVSLVQEQGIDWKIILIIVASVLIVFLIIFLVIRLFNKQKASKVDASKTQRRRKKSKK